MIRTASILGTVSILAMAVGAGCSSSPSNAPATAAARTVTPTLRVVSIQKPQVAANTVVGVLGSYQNGCQGQANGNPWILDTAGHAGAMEGFGLSGSPSAPSVVLDDSNCELEIDAIYVSATAIYSSTGATSTGSSEQLDFTGPAASAGSYLSSSVAFDDSDSTLAFYANAESSVTDASGNFQLTLLMSSDPSESSPSPVVATAQLISGDDGGVNVSNVAAPDYSTDFSNLTLGDNASCTATTVSGTINLDLNTTAGTSYFVFYNPADDSDESGIDFTTFAGVDSAWQGFVNSDATSITGTPPVQIPASEFVQTGDTLGSNEVSYIVVQNLDPSSNVPSYEVITVTFNGDANCVVPE
jgi:hypothetical protein